MSEGEFVGVGGALEERGVERADPFGVGAGGGECGAGGEVAGLLEVLPDFVIAMSVGMLK